MSLRKLGTAEPAPVEVEGASEDLARTARKAWTEDDEQELEKENDDRH